MAKHFHTLTITPAEEREPWPVHRTVAHFPNGARAVIAEAFPVGKLAETFACKYCSTEHANWWLMDQDDYQYEDVTIILCGLCEHTSGVDRA